MRFLFLLVCCVLLSCASSQPIFKPVTVEIPITIPCPTPNIAKPESSLSHIEPDASLFDKVKTTLIELDQRKIYEAEIEAALTACQQPSL